MACDRGVARERRLVHLTATRFDARPFDAQTHAVETETGDEVEHVFVVEPETVGVAGTVVTTKGDCRAIARGRLVGSVESTLDRVALERDKQSRSSLHRTSFARPPMWELNYRHVVAPRGPSKENHG